MKRQSSNKVDASEKMMQSEDTRKQEKMRLHMEQDTGKVVEEANEDVTRRKDK